MASWDDILFPNPHEISPIVTLEKRIAALKAENERLTRELETATKLKRQYLHAANHWHDKAERALAERAGGVKVIDALETIRTRSILYSQRATDGYAEIQGIAVDALNALTTEPAAPEGEQDDGHTDTDGYPYEFTRPAEQAVTEAMIEAVVQAVRQYTRETLFIDEHRDLVRAALKAAMEADR